MHGNGGGYAWQKKTRPIHQERVSSGKGKQTNMRETHPIQRGGPTLAIPVRTSLFRVCREKERLPIAPGKG
jgi:hypothetical protein